MRRDYLPHALTICFFRVVHTRLLHPETSSGISRFNNQPTPSLVRPAVAIWAKLCQEVFDERAVNLFVICSDKSARSFRSESQYTS